MGEARGQVERRTEYEPPAEGAPFEGELTEVEPGGGLDVFPKSLTPERHSLEAQVWQM